jgi:hypothetical protein
MGVNPIKRQWRIEAVFMRVADRCGKRRAIVATARKMLELTWTLEQKKRLYRYTTVEGVATKLKHYKIQEIGGKAARPKT